MVRPCEALTIMHRLSSSTSAKTLLVAVAVANKMARIAWAIMTKGGHYRAPELAAAA